MFNRKMTYLTILVQFKRPCQAVKFGPGDKYSVPAKRRKHSEEKKRVESPISKETLFDNLGDKALKLKNRSKSIVANRKFSDKLPSTTKPSRNQEASDNVKMKDPARSPSLEDNSSSEASGQSESSDPADKKCLPSNVRSPFNMTSNIESEAMSEQYENRARGKEDVS